MQMTKQIVIKLNEKKFKPILEFLGQCENNVSKSPSEIVGKCLFFNYLFQNEKLHSLDNKTRVEYLIQKQNITHSESILNFLKKYNEFLNSKNSL